MHLLTVCHKLTRCVQITADLFVTLTSPMFIYRRLAVDDTACQLFDLRDTANIAGGFPQALTVHIVCGLCYHSNKVYTWSTALRKSPCSFTYQRNGR
jgi:hypothetical protein